MADIMRLGLVLSATDRMSRVLSQATGRLSRLGITMDKVNSMSNKMLIGGGIAAAGIYKAVEAAEDGAASERKLANVFKTMWGDNGAANAAGKIASDYAEKLSLQIGVEDDLIRTTQAKLATFSNVSNAVAMSNGIFDRATRAAYDMGAVGFGEASQNAVILGKALQDPMKAITALKKQGTLTAIDILSIQNIFKTQGLLKAQEAILKAVERQVKGTGIETAKATDIMKVGFGKVVEAIGGAFLPSVDEARKKMTDVFQPTIEWIDANHELIMTITKIGGVLLAVAGVMRIVTMGITLASWAMFALNLVASLNPLGVVIMQIAALAAIIAVCWSDFAEFRAVVKTAWETVKEFGSILKDYVMDRISGIIEGLGSMGKAIGLLFHGKFSEAFDEAGRGVRALSGYDAKLKAVTRTKSLITGITSNYAVALSKEKESDRMSKSGAAMEAVTTNNRNINSGQSPFSYSPTINISGGSAQDKAGIMSMFDTQRQTLEQMMTERENRKKRLNYAQ